MEVLLKRLLLYLYVEDEEFLFFIVYFIKLGNLNINIGRY